VDTSLSPRTRPNSAAADIRNLEDRQSRVRGRSGFALAPNNTPGPEFQPLLRLYSIQNGYDYYTYNAAERDARGALTPPPGDPSFGKIGWRYEGDPGFIAVSPAAGTTIVYCLYNTVTGAHFFTESAGTRTAVLALSSTWEEQPARLRLRHG